MAGKIISRIFVVAFKTLVVTCFLLVVTLVICLFYGLDYEPEVSRPSSLSLDDVARIKEVLRENNPRRLQGQGVRKVEVTERDLNLLLAYGLSHSGLGKNLDVQVGLDPGSVIARATLIMPENLFGRYLNVRARIRPGTDDLLDWTFQGVRFGDVPFPGWVVGMAWPYVLGRLEALPEVKALLVGIEAVDKVDIRRDHVSVSYNWKSDQVEQLERRGKELILPVSERKRLLYYDNVLRTFLERQPEKRMSLAEVLQFVFSNAAEQSRSGADPVAENRAAIFTLAVYVINMDLDKLVERPKEVEGLRVSIAGDEGEADVAEPRKDRKHGFVSLQLRGRRDLAQHFLVSAAITASTGKGMADFLGLYKELGDSMSGSGFSFADMAANRAGVEMAKLAVDSRESALEVQEFLSAQMVEDDFMLRIDHLPEGIMELEFRDIYEDVDSEAYGVVEEEIERRLRECRLYQ